MDSQTAPTSVPSSGSVLMPTAMASAPELLFEVRQQAVGAGSSPRG
jgi:hypothetical protein